MVEDGRRGEFEKGFVECECWYSMYTLLKDPQSGHSSASVSKAKKVSRLLKRISAVFESADQKPPPKWYLPPNFVKGAIWQNSLA